MSVNSTEYCLAVDLHDIYAVNYFLLCNDQLIIVVLWLYLDSISFCQKWFSYRAVTAKMENY